MDSSIKQHRNSKFFILRTEKNMKKDILNCIEQHADQDRLGDAML